MTAILTTVLTLLGEIAAVTADASTIGKIIAALINLLPTLAQEFTDLLGPVRNIIAALSANPAATADQLATLQALDTADDAAFEASVTAYLAAHPASGTP